MCNCAESMGGASPPPLTRRTMLFKFGTALMVVGSALTAIPIIGFIFAPVARKAINRWVDLGKVSAFPVGQTRFARYTNPVSVPWDGSTADIPCWVRRISEDEFQVFAINCTHLGCPVKWFQESRLFMCPCHGGVYYEDGSRASGPPPRGLFKYEYKIVDGRLSIEAGRLPTLQEAV